MDKKGIQSLQKRIIANNLKRDLSPLKQERAEPLESEVIEEKRKVSVKKEKDDQQVELDNDSLKDQSVE